MRCAPCSPFFAELVRQDQPQLNFAALTSKLLVLTAGSLSKHATGALSQAVATCCTHTPRSQERNDMVERFVGDIGSDEPRAIFALQCLGEIGAQNDLSSHAKLIDRLLEGFASSADDVKNTAAFALGNIAAGNLSFYLPLLLNQVKASQHQYLLLYARSANVTWQVEHIEQMLSCLFDFAERDEDGV